MKLKEIVELSKELKNISSINKKIEIISGFFKKLNKDEFKIAISLLINENPFGKIQIGWGSLKNFLYLKETGEGIEIKDIENYLKKLSEIKGDKSRKRKLNLIYEIFKKLNKEEREFFISFLMGEVRHGASKGIIKKAISKSFNIDESKIDELILKKGDFLEIVQGIFKEGKEFLLRENFEILKPFSPMLAETIHSIDEIPYGKYAVEYKIDGIRIGAHKKGDILKIFSRNLRDITENLPEIVSILKDIKGDFVLDGEVVLLDEEGKSLPFQEIMKVISRKERERKENIMPFFFDILYKDGNILFKYKNKERWEILKETVPEKFLIKRIETDKKEEIKKFFEESISNGNEGVMIKKIDSPYFIGSRKKYWLKLKNSYTLDFVILEAEWGHGRRKGWLSNFLLGCLSSDSKKFLPLGKTFKGLTDEEFKEITKILLNKKIREKEYGIIVKPEIVVETEFSEIEKSPFYESGYSLRFARIKRIRYDKNSYEITNINEVKKIFEDFRKRKGFV